VDLSDQLSDAGATQSSAKKITGWTHDGECFSAHEILLIAYLNPIERRGPTRSSAEIVNRID
jgi:hypothetical protein